MAHTETLQGTQKGAHYPSKDEIERVSTELRKASGDRRSRREIVDHFLNSLDLGAQVVEVEATQDNSQILPS